MTSHEFVLWFKGFAEAASNYTLTPSQWDTVKEQLNKVKTPATNSGGYTISAGAIYGTTTTTTGGRADVTYKQDELTTNTVF